MSEHLNKEVLLGVDIGGSHISSALIDGCSGEILPGSFYKKNINRDGMAADILEDWTNNLRDSLKSLEQNKLAGIGIAIPGPFDYINGVSHMNGVGKYASLYGFNINDAIREKLALNYTVPLLFENDAACFGIGECLNQSAGESNRLLAITLGTGFGSTFLENGMVLKDSTSIPPRGELYNQPYLDGINEDYISGKWILAQYNERSTDKASSVQMIAERAQRLRDNIAMEVFSEFGFHLACCLKHWIKNFNPGTLVIGGSIAHASALFLPALQEEFMKAGYQIPIKISEHMEVSSIKGAASLVSKNNAVKDHLRKSKQPVLPITSSSLTAPDGYNIYPSYPLPAGSISNGYDSLASRIMTKKMVMIDGITGVDWKTIEVKLSKILEQKNVRVQWYQMKDYQLPPTVIEERCAPFIGEMGEVWGTRCSLRLQDFFDMEALSALQTETGADLHIIIGAGAAMANWDELIYFDLPKNELQFRMRAGQQVSFLQCDGLSNPEIYKRLYFVDWIINKAYRSEIQEKINIIADGQWRDSVTWAEARSVYDAFKEMSGNIFRARPWFEPGAWGGQWLKNKIKGISQEEVNYAWSFELIVPENGLVFSSNGYHLEVAFDWLMEQQAEAVLGIDAGRFGKEFPIRFDYLDTMDGGNLSIQCHPSVAYIRNRFGENITQDETYYILDCKEDAEVYLGFQDDIDPDGFRSALETSVEQNIPVDITKHVQSHPAKKHDLFLIPNQTIHSAGKNNLVLEISATPYIFTFKMYDWLRLDLEGNPRPINIEHAFNNLDFSRKGSLVKKELISQPRILEETANYRVLHLPTHEEHFYDVHRIEFADSIEMETNNKCFVMMLVEGQSILLTALGHAPVRFHFAETFIIPAGVKKFTITNETKEEIKIIKAFVK